MKHFNIDQFEKICNYDDYFKKEIANTFVETVTIDIKEIEDSLRENDIDLLKHKAHSLRSSLDFMGAEKLAKQAQEIEQLCSEKQFETAKNNCISMLKSLNEAKADMTDYVNQFEYDLIDEE